MSDILYLQIPLTTPTDIQIFAHNLVVDPWNLKIA